MDEETRPRVNLVPCVRWVKRGVAKANPEKIELTEKELEEIISKSRKEFKEKRKIDESEERNGMAVEDKYDFANYDNDQGHAVGEMNLGSIVAKKNLYITNDEADSEAEDDMIRPDDNLILVGHLQGDASFLEIYVYNEEEGSLYIHHDLILPSYPLCLEWLGMVPNSGGAPGNLCAVGAMSPVIQVWDIDLVNCLEAVCKLGRKPNKKKQVKQVGHRDAVLDLSWNTILPHILASGSVDQSVLLWDLDNCLPATELSPFSGKVQTIKWHPFESQMLLTGSCDKLVRVFDCRENNSFKKWKIDGEVERVIWNHFKPFDFLASSDSGKVYYVDCRMDEPLWKLEDPQFSEVTGLTLSAQCPGMMTTASIDGQIKVWDIGDANCFTPPTLVFQNKTNIGAVHCLEACPDSPFVVCAGGDERSNNFEVWNLLDEHLPVKERFSSRQLLLIKTVKCGEESQNTEDTDDAEATDDTEDTKDTEASEAYEATLTTVSRKRKTKASKNSSLKKK